MRAGRIRFRSLGSLRAIALLSALPFATVGCITRGELIKASVDRHYYLVAGGRYEHDGGMVGPFYLSGPYSTLSSCAAHTGRAMFATTKLFLIALCAKITDEHARSLPILLRRALSIPSDFGSTQGQVVSTDRGFKVLAQQVKGSPLKIVSSAAGYKAYPSLIVLCFNVRNISAKRQLSQTYRFRLLNEHEREYFGGRFVAYHVIEPGAEPLRSTESDCLGRSMSDDFAVFGLKTWPHEARLSVVRIKFADGSYWTGPADDTKGKR